MTKAPGQVQRGHPRLRAGHSGDLDRADELLDVAQELKQPDVGDRPDAFVRVGLCGGIDGGKGALYLVSV